MENPVVSVRCITYNHESYIRRALDGFLMQKTDFPFEIVVHDDASTDRTPEILQEYRAKYPDRIRLILQTENQYSQGHRVADFINPELRGRYIALCEGDDYWTDEEKLQRQVDYLEQNPDCALAAHQAICVDDGGSFLRDYYSGHGDSDYDMDFEDMVRGLSRFPTASMMFRRSFLEENRERLSQLPTFDYVYKLLLAASGRVHVMTRSMAAYRVAARGSWTVRVARDPARYMAHLETSVKALTSIDRLLDFRYREVLHREILSREYELLEYRGDYRGMRQGEFRQIYLSKGTGYRLQMALKYRLPGLYGLLRRMKRNEG